MFGRKKLDIKIKELNEAKKELTKSLFDLTKAEDEANFYKSFYELQLKGYHCVILNRSDLDYDKQINDFLKDGYMYLAVYNAEKSLFYKMQPFKSVMTLNG